MKCTQSDMMLLLLNLFRVSLYFMVVYRSEKNPHQNPVTHDVVTLRAAILNVTSYPSKAVYLESWRGRPCRYGVRQRQPRGNEVWQRALLDEADTIRQLARADRLPVQSPPFRPRYVHPARPAPRPCSFPPRLLYRMSSPARRRRNRWVLQLLLFHALSSVNFWHAYLNSTRNGFGGFLHGA